MLQKDILAKHFHGLFFLLIVGAFFTSCKSYKQHIMFKIDEEEDLSYLSSDITVVEKNYIIQANDLLELRVYTNNGERIIDPNNELLIEQNQNAGQYQLKFDASQLTSGVYIYRLQSGSFISSKK